MSKAEDNIRDSVRQHVPEEIFNKMPPELVKDMTRAALTVGNNVDIKLSGNEFTGNNLSHTGKSTKGGGLSA